MTETMHGKKTKWSLIPTEDLDLNVWYSFTISPIGKYQGDQYSTAIKILYGLSKYCNLHMVLELSTLARRVHFHGKIQFKTNMNIVKFYNSLGENKSYTTFEMDTIKDPEKWEKYIYKNKRYYEEYSQKMDWIYEVTNTSIKNKKDIKDQFIMDL